MEKIFQFEEQVTYSHTIEVDIPTEREEEFEDFCCKVAEKMYREEYDDAACIAAEFERRFGGENVTFCKDGSPDTDFEAI